MESISDADLAALERLEQAATAGPWLYAENDDCWQLFGGDGPMPLQLLKAPKRDTPYAEYWPTETDAELLCQARNALPQLLAEIRLYRNSRTTYTR